MMAWVHASIGAYIGGEIGGRKRPWLAGIASHLIADLTPHRDYDLPVELPLLGAALAVVVWRFGIDSPEMAGALGGITPDFENGLARLGLIPETLFPTHTTRPWFIGHGGKARTVLPQVVLALTCLYLADRRRSENRTR